MDNDASKPESAPSFGNRVKRIVMGLAPWVISGAIILFIVSTEDIGQVARDFTKIDLSLFLMVTIPFLVLLLILETFFLLIGFRWFAGVGKFGDLLRVRAATYLLTVVSIFVGLGGLVIYGKRRYGVSYKMGTTIVLNELLHELASQCTLALMVGLLLPIELIPDKALPAVQGVTLVGMIGVGIYLFILVISRLTRYMPAGFRGDHVFDPFTDISLQQYAAFYSVKLVQNILYGLFLAGLLYSFAINPPIIASIGFMQIIHLTRAIPISAFGIGVDQIAIKYLFEAWEPAGTGLLLASSGAFTFTLIFGRALLGVPFLKSVLNDLVERPEEDKQN